MFKDNIYPFQFPSSPPRLLPDPVKSTPSPQPLHLVPTHRMSRPDLILLPTRPRHFQNHLISLQRPIQQLVHAAGHNLVERGDARVVALVDKPKGEDTLLLEVGFVDPGEGAGEDEGAAVVAGLECRVFTCGTFSVWDVS